MSRRTIDGRSGDGMVLFRMLAREGLEIVGGCDSCAAYQSVEEIEPDVFCVHVYHDDTCPEQMAREGRP